jgi:hypothetical protein
MKMLLSPMDFALYEYARNPGDSTSSAVHFDWPSDKKQKKH